MHTLNPGVSVPATPPPRAAALLPPHLPVQSHCPPHKTPHSQPQQRHKNYKPRTAEGGHTCLPADRPLGCLSCAACGARCRSIPPHRTNQKVPAVARSLACQLACAGAALAPTLTRAHIACRIARPGRLASRRRWDQRTGGQEGGFGRAAQCVLAVLRVPGWTGGGRFSIGIKAPTRRAQPRTGAV